MDVDTERTEELRILELDETALIIDGAVIAFRRGVLLPMEAVTKICTTVAQFVRWSIGGTHEVDLIIEFARDAVDQVADTDGVKDPLLVEYFDERVLADQMTDVLQARLDSLLEPLALAVRQRDAVAASQLTDLCRSGLRSHRLLLGLAGTSERILRTVYRLGLAAALRDAVSPVHAHDGQIANHAHRPAAFELTFNLLAHLAAEPESGSDARAALLDLAGLVETAGEAAIRLPMHLLADSERQRLLAVHEARVDLFTTDPIQVPLGLEVLRDNRVVRSAVWQAFDARHII